MDPPSVLNIHTPSSSFAIVHSLTQETLLDLYNKLSRKTSTDYYGARVGPGWLKYEYNDAVWNLDDDSDYAIFVWRRQQQQQQHQNEHYMSPSVPQTPIASSSRTQLPPSPPSIAPPPPSSMPSSPTLHLRSPSTPLPSQSAYRNPAFYIFHPSRAAVPTAPPRRSPAPSHASTNGKRSKKGKEDAGGEGDGVPKFKKQFDRFHSENGVRTVMGQIGPVHNVRMLLKSGYRHVYLSRKFAIKHGFIPADAAPGNYGYGGLVNIGSWPIILTPSSTQPTRPAQGYQRPDAFLTPAPSPIASPYSSPRTNGAALPANAHPSSSLHSNSAAAAPGTNGLKATKSSGNKSGSINGKRGGAGAAGNERVGPDTRGGHGTGAGVSGPKPVMVEVYLSEEPHFDVVLGRSFIEKRQIKMHSIDPTDVVCLDTGEKIECELVILKDGRGEIVTVT